MTPQTRPHTIGTVTSTRRHNATLAWAALLAATVAVTVAACGGSNKPSGSGVSGLSAELTNADKYAACMRSQGVSFADPQISTSGGHQSLSFHLDPTVTSSPAFKSAQAACAHLLPGQPTGLNAAQQQQAQTAALLAFARCMRQHGFGSFPDPNTQGEPWTLAMLTNAHINLKEPAVRPAALACTTVTHGILTNADVEKAIANPNELTSQAPGTP
jgi:hypothetical protein